MEAAKYQWRRYNNCMAFEKIEQAPYGVHSTDQQETNCYTLTGNFFKACLKLSKKCLKLTFIKNRLYNLEIDKLFVFKVKKKKFKLLF